MNPAQFLMFVVGLLLVLEVFVLVRAQPILGLWLLMGVSLLNYADVRFEIEVIGYQVYALDIVMVILALVAIERRLTDDLRRPGLGIVVVLFLVALVRGLPTFGVETAVNASRAILYLLVAIGFASACRITLESAQKVWIAGGVVVGVEALVFWLDNGLGTYARDGSRAMFWAEALIVSQAAILLLAKRERASSQLGAVLLLAVVLSQQRTVWAATIIAVVVGALSESRVRSTGETSSFRTRVIAMGVIVGALIVIGPSDARQSFSYAASSISTGSGTLGWRIEGWIEILRTFSNGTVVNQIIGQPFGTGFERRLNIGVVDVSPHNMYITALLTFGVLGTLAFFTVIATAIKRSLIQRSILGALVSGLLVLSIGYEIPLTSGILIGIALTSQVRSGSPAASGAREGNRGADTSAPARSSETTRVPRSS